MTYLIFNKERIDLVAVLDSSFVEGHIWQSDLCDDKHYFIMTHLYKYEIE